MSKEKKDFLGITQERLATLITMDKVKDVIENLNPELTPQQEWYKASYPVFLDIFKDTSGSKDISAWVKRISCVFSWIAHIPTPNLP